MFTELIFINNGKRTKWSSIRSVSVRVINKIGRTFYQLFINISGKQNIDGKKILHCGYSSVIFSG